MNQIHHCELKSNLIHTINKKKAMIMTNGEFYNELAGHADYMKMIYPK